MKNEQKTYEKQQEAIDKSDRLNDTRRQREGSLAEGERTHDDAIGHDRKPTNDDKLDAEQGSEQISSQPEF